MIVGHFNCRGAIRLYSESRLATFRGDRECGTRKSPRLIHFLPRLGTKCPSHGRTGLDRGAREGGEGSGNPGFPSRWKYLTTIVNWPRRWQTKSAGGPPRLSGGPAPALPLWRPARRPLLVAACMLAKSRRDLLHWTPQPLHCLHDRSNCYRLEGRLPGGSLTHRENVHLTPH